MTGQDIKELRERLGWTRGQLASYLGLSVHTIQSVEIGRGKLGKPAVKLLRLLEPA